MYFNGLMYGIYHVLPIFYFIFAIVSLFKRKLKMFFSKDNCL